MIFRQWTDAHGTVSIACDKCPATKTSRSPAVIRAWKLAHAGKCASNPANHPGRQA